MKPSDLAQPQREALVSLMLAATYADHHVGLSENAAVRSTFDSIGWDSGTSFDIHYAEVSAEIRTAAEAEDGLAAFVESCCASFESDAEKELAIGHLAEVLHVDGRDDGEDIVFEAAKKALAI